jgi:Mg2+/Co2+ transporter CorB
VLIFIMAPISWFTNKAAYGFLRLFGVKPVSESGQTMSPDELRSVVAEAGPMIPTRHRQMLLSILDLEHVTVNDIMIPRHDIASINVEDNWDDILDQLRQTPHTRLPLHEGELDNLIGIVHMKRVAQELARDTLTRERLIEIAQAREPYFVPEGTSLTMQLNQFQRNRRRMAFVVDEYGDIQGFVTLEDILEEIVGEFTSDPATVTHKHVHREAPGVFIINAGATVRALNRALGWQLPVDGPKTLNGLLVEQLEALPEAGESVTIGEYQFEVIQTGENTVRTVRARRITPAAE